MSITTDTVQVSLGARSYDIRIGTGNLADLGSIVSGSGPVSQAVIITDTHVDQPHAEAAVASLQAASVKVEVLVVDPGERTKSVKTAWLLWDKLLELGVDRHAAILAVGGGVIGDLAGFIAATFARGLNFWQVPTTLLAQVDSSVGGKVGVNLGGGKNLVGSFWQPRGVLIDTAVLHTLPPREYRAGLAEVVKYGVILDGEFFAYLEKHAGPLQRRDPEVLRHVIARSCRLKADVVAEDEREETGRRAVLNYGHTFCHAFETLTRYTQLLHGEGVSIGMICASRLAERLGRVDSAVTARQQRLLRSLGLPTYVPKLNADKVLSVMRRDKKAVAGRLRFVLPTAIGHVELVDDVPAREVKAVLQSGRPDLQRGPKPAKQAAATDGAPAEAQPASEVADPSDLSLAHDGHVGEASSVEHPLPEGAPDLPPPTVDEQADSEAATAEQPAGESTADN